MTHVNELADKGFELAPDAKRCEAGASFDHTNNIEGSCGAGQPLYVDPATGWIVCHNHSGWPLSDEARLYRRLQAARKGA
jgi:hypothetical protein